MDDAIPFTAYTGGEPFIFASYAHLDKAIVYPELRRLHDAGYRIWYDQGIKPSSEWMEDIAQALDQCTFFLVFMSPEAAASKYVMREINYAIDISKPFLTVFIQDTTLPSKLKLAINVYQHIFKKGLPEPVYVEKLLSALPPETKRVPAEDVARRKAEQEKAARDKTERDARERNEREEAARKRKVEEEARKPRDYHGTALAAGEWAAMMDLERALGGKAIPAVPDLQWNTFGFSVEQEYVVKLGLYQQGLTSLPETIGQLANLQKIWLSGNKLSSLPGTIGQLKSLTTLDLSYNQLSSLPVTIGELKSIQILRLNNNKLSSLPETIWELKALTYLSLSSNKLSSLPDPTSRGAIDPGKGRVISARHRRHSRRAGRVGAITRVQPDHAILEEQDRRAPGSRLHKRTSSFRALR
jgi:hypothetical protein